MAGSEMAIPELEGTGKTGMSGAEAAAILLMLLDEDCAAEVLADLGPDEIKSIGTAMYRSVEATDVQVATAIDSFLDRGRSLPILAADADPRIRNVIARAVGDTRAETILGGITSSAGAPTVERLKWMPLSALRRVVAGEHPQVAAIVIAALSPELAAAVIEDMPPEDQADLLERAANLGKISADAFAELEALLAAYDEKQPASPAIAVGGRGEIARIVNSMAKPAGERALKAVKRRDKALAQAIEDEMFVFDDLIGLDAMALGAVLRNVESGVLTLALRGASPELMEAALASMSGRAAQALRDEIGEMGPVKRADVDAAQRSVIAAARALAEDGAIQIGPRGDDYV